MLTVPFHGGLFHSASEKWGLLAAMEGRDPCDSTSVGIEGGIVAPSREDLSGLRFGVPAELARDRPEGSVCGESDRDRFAFRRGPVRTARQHRNP